MTSRVENRPVEKRYLLAELSKKFDELDSKVNSLAKSILDKNKIKYSHILAVDCIQNEKFSICYNDTQKNRRRCPAQALTDEDKALLFEYKKISQKVDRCLFTSALIALGVGAMAISALCSS